MRSHVRACLVLVGLLALSLGVGCAPAASLNSRLDDITDSYEFNALKWEAGSLLAEARNVLVNRNHENAGDVDTVTRYFATMERIHILRSQVARSAVPSPGDPTPLQSELSVLQQQMLSSRLAVQRIIGAQVEDTIHQQSIYNPVDQYLGLRITFPPLKFAVGPPPQLLVVSPRDHIELIRSVILRQDVDLKQAQDIEAKADGLSVSSLVTELGGFAGTYPSFVTDQASLRFTVQTIAHEWLHQYLAFKPLGFGYVLDATGISRNRELVTINETVADIFGREIASFVLERYYGASANTTRPPRTESEFDRQMRETRRTVDQYLARGEIETAEKYMEQRREELAASGYYIRKLNQAYFAFNGTYGDNPASVGLAGSNLRKLRSQQKSLKDFLAVVSVITSRQQLIAAMK